MKEKILVALKAKFTGVPEVILDRIATKMAKTITTEDQVNSQVEGMTLQYIFDSYGDSRATEASQTAVSNYEKKHSIKDGKPIIEPAPAPIPIAESGQSDNTPKYLTADDVQTIIANALKPIAETVAQREQQTKQEKRSAEILAKAKEYGIPASQAKRYSVPEDADLDTYFKEVKQELTNEGFAGVKTPERGAGASSENEEIASMITSGTKEIVEQKKAN